jgi:hypothetical protein
MMRGRTAQKILLYGIVAVMALSCVAQSAFAQIVDRKVWRQTFLSRDYRPRWGESKENFGSYDLRRYSSADVGWSQYNNIGSLSHNDRWNNALRGPVTPVSYDPFGNFLLPGGEIYAMNWNRSSIGASQSRDSQWMTGVFNNLVIMSDEMGSWQSRFMISETNNQSGTGIRAYFTPSTLKLTNFRGFRWDASSRKNNITLLASPGNRMNQNMPLYGVHWESKLGDILSLGASYVSRQRGTTGYSHNDIERDIRDEPRYAYVVVTDDSPEDTVGDGAMVYGIKAFINGKEEPIAFKGEGYAVRGRVMKIPDILTTNQYYKLGSSIDFQDQYIFKDLYGGSTIMHRDTSELRNNRDSWFIDLINAEGSGLSAKNTAHRIFHKGKTYGLANLLTEQFTGDPADRYDPDVPGDIEYQRYYDGNLDKVGVLEAQGTDIVVFELELPPGTRSAEFNVNVSNDYCIDIVVPHYQYAQSTEGDYFGKPFTDDWTGKWSVETYDMRHCAKAPGQVKDGSNQKWVRVRYNRLTGMNVYGMNLELNWRGFFMRAEYNESNTFWSYPLGVNASGGKKYVETSRAYFVNAQKDFGDFFVGAEVFNYPAEYMQYNEGSQWNFIEDNDDNDRYPGNDSMVGLDSDFDRYVDTTWSGQPFLRYFYDSVTVGDDFNHDGTVDRRENDSLIDLPYDRDSQGQHLFVKYQPKEATIMTLGHYDVEQEYMGGRNFTRYLKVEHHKRIRDIGEFLFYNRTERIQDDYKLNNGSRYPTLHHNEINNWKTTNILQTRLYMIPNTTIINNARFTTSYNVGSIVRNEGTVDEMLINYMQVHNNGDMINQYGGYSYTLEHKADYMWRVADLRLLPQVSLMGYRLWREKRLREMKLSPMIKVVHSYGWSQQNDYALSKYDRSSRSLEVYPIIRFDYRIAPKTLLRLGIQGLGGAPEVYRRRTSGSSELNDYNKRNVVLAFENQSLYEGFNLLVMAGMRYSKKEWINDKLAKDDGYTEYFITFRSEAQ